MHKIKRESSFYSMSVSISVLSPITHVSTLSYHQPTMAPTIICTLRRLQQRSSHATCTAAAAATQGAKKKKTLQ